ncbi:GNAT family N-acetyltransferase [Streptomyces sp. NPDC087300]|uniref:GNAT family N-acetyltransferase n=1 Tax=Streptomyces sp. NPDC087300 TaxID=3365780 RepID=UPI0038249C83
MSRPARPPAAHFEHVPGTLPASCRALMMLDPEERPIGCLQYRLCHPCGRGHIVSIAVAAHWQGQGLARHALHTVLAAGEGYAWSTSRQSPEGRRFFAAMEEETEIAFPAGGARCPHLAEGD